MKCELCKQGRLLSQFGWHDDPSAAHSYIRCPDWQWPEVQSEQPPPSTRRCACPNGSYGVKHTNQCYEAQIERLQRDLAEAESDARAANVRADQMAAAWMELKEYKLPCDVHLPPNTYIGRGCPLSTLMTALKRRERNANEFPVEFPPPTDRLPDGTPAHVCHDRIPRIGKREDCTVCKSIGAPEPPKRLLSDMADEIIRRLHAEGMVTMQVVFDGACLRIDADTREPGWTNPRCVHCGWFGGHKKDCPAETKEAPQQSIGDFVQEVRENPEWPEPPTIDGKEAQ